MVTDSQVRLLRHKLMQGKRQIAAAAAAGMSERTARTWKAGVLPSATKALRDWRTRPDPFAEVWETELVPLLMRDEERVLEARTLLCELEKKHTGRFSEGQIRTLQRRMRTWRALHGPDREVMFPQEHVPGRECAFDFTHGKELGVTIRGELFEHLLFEFVLSFSGWTWACVAFSETFEALSMGWQGALWDLGGCPEVSRSDNLSAATHELKLTGGRTLTRRYRDLLDHYGVLSSRIRPGKSHENGVVEQKHYRTKSAIAQALVIRGSKDFATVDEYEAFVRSVVAESNRSRGQKLSLERERLRPLPSSTVPFHTTFHPHVTCWSTVRVGGRIYSVPSRLIGHDVEVRQHPDTVEVYYAGKLAETMPRIRGEKSARIDYRHVIWSLVRKPGAFARYRYREELFPSLTFRKAYDALCARPTERADIEYVRILHLAASTMESVVEASLATLLASGEAFDYARVKQLAAPQPQTVPSVSIPKVDLALYDRMLEEAAGAA
ncbi:MAG: IS21 family transposase [Candidatus Methylomirabilaceae bacterium]